MPAVATKRSSWPIGRRKRSRNSSPWGFRSRWWMISAASPPRCAGPSRRSRAAAGPSTSTKPPRNSSTAISQDVPVFDGLPPAQAVMVEHFEWKGQDALALLGFLKQTEADRVGPTPTSLDPDSLQSTPQLGVKAVVQAASEQVELIARNFAATGMKQLGRLLLRLLVEHQPRKRIVRLRGQYVEVDPRAWDAEMDVSINVAL